jgi:hypothetical protein
MDNFMLLEDEYITDTLKNTAIFPGGEDDDIEGDWGDEDDEDFDDLAGDENDFHEIELADDEPLDLDDDDHLPDDDF